jgi:hypothetical protein
MVVATRNSLATPNEPTRRRSVHGRSVAWRRVESNESNPVPIVRILRKELFKIVLSSSLFGYSKPPGRGRDCNTRVVLGGWPLLLRKSYRPRISLPQKLKSVEWFYPLKVVRTALRKGPFLKPLSPFTSISE